MNFQNVEFHVILVWLQCDTIVGFNCQTLNNRWIAGLVQFFVKFCAIGDTMIPEQKVLFVYKIIVTSLIYIAQTCMIIQIGTQNAM